MSEQSAPAEQGHVKVDGAAMDGGAVALAGDELAQEKASTDDAAAPGMRGSLLWTFALPKQVWFLMLLETLDHYRLGLRIMQSQYLVMEWGMSDVEVG
jgi:hypothetical protein|eukprot:COSAG02_NODE_184_length_30545_cov_128.634402_7_plen_98_part_00